MFRDRDIVGIEPTLTIISFIKYQDKSIKMIYMMYTYTDLCLMSLILCLASASCGEYRSRTDDLLRARQAL